MKHKGEETQICAPKGSGTQRRARVLRPGCRATWARWPPKANMALSSCCLPALCLVMLLRGLHGPPKFFGVSHAFVFFYSHFEMYGGNTKRYQKSHLNESPLPFPNMYSYENPSLPGCIWEVDWFGLKRTHFYHAGV